MIVGVDEVGRGSLAGPLCVAAVVWPKGARLKGLNDSKQVAKAERVRLALKIRQRAVAIGIGWAPASLIDRNGLTFALRHAAQMAVGSLGVEYEQIIVDGNLRLLDDPRARHQIKADCTVPAVMAASIIAKVARDSYMHKLSNIYGEYGFDSHVGYCTKQHLNLLQQFGPCEIHRFSYAPVKTFVV